MKLSFCSLLFWGSASAGGTCLHGSWSCHASPDDAAEEDDDASSVVVSLMQKSLQPTLRSRGREDYTRSMQHLRQIGRTEHMTCADYDAVVATVHRLYSRLPRECSGSYCPQGDWAGCILRAAAHDFMDYKSGIGGMDGCLNLNDPDSNGLSECLYEGVNGVSLKEAYSEWITQISLPDFLIISAEAVMNITRQNVLKEDSTRQTLDFRARFKYGRATSMNCTIFKGKLPDAERGCDAVKDTLISNMGLTWTQAAALMGAHTIGSAKANRSGYRGYWTDVSSSRKFDNNYYVSMLLKGWAPEPAVFGNPKKNQWRRVDLGVDLDRSGHEMMLDTDLCLYFSNPNNGHFSASLAASPDHCKCTWIRLTPEQSEHVLNESKQDQLNGAEREAISKYNNGHMCGVGELFDASSNLDVDGNKFNITKQRIACCSMQDIVIYEDHSIDCASTGPAYASVVLFASSEDTWLASFYEAWDIAVSRGHTSLSGLSGC